MQIAETSTTAADGSGQEEGNSIPPHIPPPEASPGSDPPPPSDPSPTDASPTDPLKSPPINSLPVPKPPSGKMLYRSHSEPFYKQRPPLKLQIPSGFDFDTADMFEPLKTPPMSPLRTATPRLRFSGADLIQAATAERESELIKLVKVMVTGSRPLQIMNRRYHMRYYKQCFIGREFVDWLVERRKRTRKQASAMGREMTMKKLFYHVAKKQPFKDGYFFYRFNDEIFPNLTNAPNNEEGKNGSNTTWPNRLARAIKDKSLMSYFEKFLRKSFCAENIQFFKAVEFYQDLNPAKRNVAAKQIYETFICDGAVNWVNLNGAVRLRIESNLEFADPYLFDDAKKEIFELLANDCFLKFCQSRYYEDYLNLPDAIRY